MDNKMERYMNKKDLLVHVGRSEKDVRWIDRALERGEVIKRDRGYCLCREYIEELEKHPVVNDPVDNKELLEKIERLKRDNQLIIEDNVRLTREKVELEEKLNNNPVGDSSDLDFQIEQNERLEGEKARLIEGIKKAYLNFYRGYWGDFINKLGVADLLSGIDME